MIRAVIASFLLLACGCADAPPKVQGVQMFVWAFHRSANAEMRFAQAIVPPGESTALRPFDDCDITVATGAPAWTTVSDFFSNWRESTVPLRIHYGRTGTETSVFLAEPLFLPWTHGTERAEVSWIMLAASLETLKSPSVARVLRGTLHGDPAEIEDLLLAAVDDGKVELETALDVYDLLLDTRVEPQRGAESARRMDRYRDDRAAVAAAVAMRPGDDAGTRRYCAMCLTRRGNDQIELIEALFHMPPSETLLDTMLRLLATNQDFRQKLPPGWAIGDMGWGARERMISYVNDRYDAATIQRHVDRILRENPHARRGLEPILRRLRTGAATTTMGPPDVP